MRWHLKRRVALVVALVAMLAGGTAVALAATGATGSHHGGHAHAGKARHGLLAAAAGYLGISRAELRKELGSGKTLAQIAAATPGRSEAGLVAALSAAARRRLSERSADVTPRIERLVNGQPAQHGHSTRARRVKVLAAVLAYLGISRRDLVAKLRSGQSLDQIAAATPGKSEAGLRAAVLAPLEQRLAQRAAAHAFSKTSEGRRRERLEKRVTKMLSHAAHHHGLRPTPAG